MSWFEHINGFKPKTFIRSGAMNSILERISQCFNWLPAANETGVGPKGFVEPLAVGAASHPNHAATVGQIVSGAYTLGLDSGTANHYDVVIPITIDSYTENLSFSFKPAHNSTGPSEVQLNGLGYVPLLFADGRQMGHDSLIDSAVVSFRYNGAGAFIAESMLAGDTAYINGQRIAAQDAAEESKQWAIGEPSEPTEGSSKHWADESRNKALEVASYDYLRSDTTAEGGMGASTTSTLDWNSQYVARAGCSPHLLLGWEAHGPGENKYYHSFSFEYGTKDGSGNLTQFAIGYTEDRMHMRHRFQGNWSLTWSEFLLDGQYGTNLRSGRIHTDGRSIARFITGTLEFGQYADDTVINGVTVGVTAVNGTHHPGFTLKSDNSGDNSGYVEPHANNMLDLGTASMAFRHVYSYAYPTASDERLKDIQPIGDTSWIYDVEPIAYTWKTGATGLRFGVSAQQARKVVGQGVDLVEEGRVWSVQMDQLIAPLMNELKILRKRVEELENA